jgi:hypothetical protein
LLSRVLVMTLGNAKFGCGLGAADIRFQVDQCKNCGEAAQKDAVRSH